MAEYIKREDVKRLVNNNFSGLLAAIDLIPAADVAPVVHGMWESVDSSYWRWTSSNAVSVSHTTYRCGRCGWGTVVKTNYCPNCGAKMDEKEAVYD